ncbi:sensor histidine kinase [Streptomyces sp. MAR4 CNX-425]|uniref:sensor histidine kinase n=1 Tax=Streptomyces sp. MAR4 CNX-425 TaxID=3406343 RepID=UPI003B50E3EC
MTETFRKTIQDGLAVLRHELISGAAGVRPLPPLSTDGPGWAVFPVEVRRALVWLVHGVVVLFAVSMFWLSYAVYAGRHSYDGPDWSTGLTLLLGLTAAVPLLLVLIQPIAAWWLSLAGVAAVGVAGLDVDPWPFAEPTFPSHLTVMVVVALRSRPVVAAAVWAGTVAVGVLLATVASPRSWKSDNVTAFAVWSAVALGGALLLRAWLEARNRLAASDDATLAERSKRTVLEERTTIARELHDVVAHHMSVIAIQAEAAPYRVENIPPELAASFGTIRENAVAALAELRRVLGVIRVADFEGYDAPEAPQPTLDALDALLDNVREAGLPVDKVVTGARRDLPPGVELSAFRVIQEALSNALRHSPGSATRVELAYVLGGLGLRVVNGPAVADEASGTASVPAGSGSGHGITGMRERVAVLDGEMTAGPTPDGGYEVVVFLPAPALVESPAATEEDA